MFGLEPIAALGVACNILQLVGVGLETVRVARQVYQDGALDPALTENATVLGNLSKSVRSAIPVTTTTRHKAQDKQLIDLADRCRDAARDLQEEVNFLNGQPTKAKLVATLKIAAKTTWRKRRLDRLDLKLKEAESLLQTGLLTKIYTRSIETDRNLLSLDTNLHAFIKDYHKGHADAIEITKKHISSESQRNEGELKHHVTQVTSRTENAVKQHVDLAIRSISDQNKDAQITQRVEKLLRSLKFDRMNERKNHVSTSHPKTCTWILQDGSEEANSHRSTDIFNSEPSIGPSFEAMESSFGTIPWDSFSDWLRSTETTYWISGKPGSGKSTVMKYLITQSRTKEYLNVWRPDAMIVSHYFWRSGSIMQHSVKGLLCSLVHQLLSGNLPIAQQVLQIHKDILQKDVDTDWSEEELQKILEDIVSGYDRPIVTFLDGLDEILPKDGVQKLMRMVDRLRGISESKGKIKICLASRPEPLLFKLLEHYPKLRLEHLNWTDLRQYVQDNIQIPGNYKISQPLPSYLLTHVYGTEILPDIPNRDKLKHWLMKTLVEKAEGVFLWLYLTVTTVVNALEEGQTFEDLNSHIENLPADLSDLFVDMWGRTNDNNVHLKRRAAVYFQLAIAGTEDLQLIMKALSPFSMMVATNSGMRNQIFEPDPSGPIPVELLIEECERTRQDAMARCAGLLVCSKPTKDFLYLQDSPIPWPQYGEEYDKLVPYVFEAPQYSLLHRTVRDFLIETNTGKDILGHGRLTSDLAQLKLIEAELAVYQLFHDPPWFQHVISITHRSRRTQNLMVNLLWSVCKYRPDIKDLAFQKEQTRLILLVKQLFDHGVLFGCLSVEPGAMQFDQISRRSFYGAYETTVKRQYEFFIESTLSTTAVVLELLLPVFKNRNVDVDTLSQILIQLCGFRRKHSYEDTGSQVAFINHVLDCGAPPESPCLYRILCPDTDKASFFIAFGTPLKALITLLWNDTICPELPEGSFDRFLGLVFRLVDGGASLQQQIHVVIRLSKGRILFDELWQEQPFKNNGCMRFILAYPISSLLAIICRIREESSGSRVDNSPELGQLANEGFGQGQLVAAIDDSEFWNEGHITSTPGIFRVAGGIYIPEPGDDIDKDLTRLLRFLEYSLDEAIRKNECLEQDEYGTFFNVKNVSIPPDIETGAIQALQRMDAANVSLKERRRRLREILGIYTPLEEAEWQGNDYEESLKPPPPFTRTSLF